ncbi:hypothetical protein GCM10010274_60550 [Streptomyces lavendofoliae]|uniref:Uncharacterized protein n=1 Tax=Streptomyces lavendofoliae TaxID=67314 RepID=A0A918M7V0_9ACTN|nr:hypothetical protein GCM10010274_60550 [Streptomyces lavendofoliae]
MVPSAAVFQLQAVVLPVAGLPSGLPGFLPQVRGYRQPIEEFAQRGQTLLLALADTPRPGREGIAGRAEWDAGSEGHVAPHAAAGRATLADRLRAAAERLAEEAAQRAGGLAARAGTQAEGLLSTALGVLGEAGQEERQNGEYDADGDDSGDHHGWTYFLGGALTLRGV